MKFLNSTLAVVPAAFLALVWARFLGHGDVFSPFLAMAVATGFLGNKSSWSWLPMLVLFIGDALHGFHTTMLVTYPLTYLAINLGFIAKGKSPVHLFAYGYLGIFTFDFLANSMVWYMGHGVLATKLTMYPDTFAGYVTCLLAGVPFHLAKLYAWVVIFGTIQAAAPLWKKRAEPVYA